MCGLPGRLLQHKIPVVTCSLQIEIGSTKRRSHKKLVQGSLAYHRWRRGLCIECTESFLDQVVRVLEMAGLNLRLHTLHHFGLMDFKVHGLTRALS